MSATRYPWKFFLKKTALIAVPVALQNLLTTTGSMVDTMMIASLGQTEVGAVGLCAQFSSLMFACYWGFVGGGMLFFSQFWGAKDDEGINRSYGLTLTCMMTVSLVFCVLATCFPETVMRLLPGGDKFHYIFTTPNTHRARTAEEMLALWGKQGVAINDPKEAIAYALAHASEQDAVFIGGSNYLVGEALQIRNS